MGETLPGKDLAEPLVTSQEGSRVVWGNTEFMASAKPERPCLQAIRIYSALLFLWSLRIQSQNIELSFPPIQMPNIFLKPSMFRGESIFGYCMESAKLCSICFL